MCRKLATIMKARREGWAGELGIWLVIFGLMEVTLTWRLRSAGG